MIEGYVLRSVQIALVSLTFSVLSANFGHAETAETNTRGFVEILDLLAGVEPHHPQLRSLRAELKGTREVLNELDAAYRPNLFLESNIRSS